VPTDWRGILERFEYEIASSRGQRMRAQELKNEVVEALSKAESEPANAKVIDRLDMMLIVLTEAAKENVCTNTKCPHYDKKCKMR
jgi:hypothetical protein